MKQKHKIAAFWAGAILIIAAFDFGAFLLIASFVSDLKELWEGNIADFVFILILAIGVLFVVTINITMFFEAKNFTKKWKPNSR
jgi:hypothetical protein